MSLGRIFHDSVKYVEDACKLYPKRAKAIIFLSLFAYNNFSSTDSFGPHLNARLAPSNGLTAALFHLPGVDLVTIQADINSPVTRISWRIDASGKSNNPVMKYECSGDILSSDFDATLQNPNGGNPSTFTFKVPEF